MHSQHQPAASSSSSGKLCSPSLSSKGPKGSRGRQLFQKDAKSRSPGVPPAVSKDVNQLMAYLAKLPKAASMDPEEFRRKAAAAAKIAEKDFRRTQRLNSKLSSKATLKTGAKLSKRLQQHQEALRDGSGSVVAWSDLVVPRLSGGFYRFAIPFPSASTVEVPASPSSGPPVPSETGLTNPCTTVTAEAKTRTRTGSNTSDDDISLSGTHSSVSPNDGDSWGMPGSTFPVSLPTPPPVPRLGASSDQMVALSFEPILGLRPYQGPPMQATQSAPGWDDREGWYVGQLQGTALTFENQAPSGEANRSQAPVRTAEERAALMREVLKNPYSEPSLLIPGVDTSPLHSADPRWHLGIARDSVLIEAELFPENSRPTHDIFFRVIPPKQDETAHAVARQEQKGEMGGGIAASAAAALEREGGGMDTEEVEAASSPLARLIPMPKHSAVDVSTASTAEPHSKPVSASVSPMGTNTGPGRLGMGMVEANDCFPPLSMEGDRQADHNPHSYGQQAQGGQCRQFEEGRVVKGVPCTRLVSSSSTLFVSGLSETGDGEDTEMQMQQGGSGLFTEGGDSNRTNGSSAAFAAGTGGRLQMEMVMDELMMGGMGRQ